MIEDMTGSLFSGAVVSSWHDVEKNKNKMHIDKILYMVPPVTIGALTTGYT